MKRSLFIVLAVCLILAICPIYAAEDVKTEQTINAVTTAGAAEKLAVSWLLDNYSQFYDVKNVEVLLDRTHLTRDATNYYFEIYCEKRLKAADVTELPYVKALYEELDKTEADAGVRAMADRFVGDIDLDNYHSKTVTIVVSSNQNGMELYTKSSLDSTLYPIDVLAFNTDEMYANGKKAVSEFIQ